MFVGETPMAWMVSVKSAEMNTTSSTLQRIKKRSVQEKPLGTKGNMKHHKLFYGSSYDRYTLIIRRAIVSSCKQLNAISVKRMLKKVLAILKHISTTSVIKDVRVNGRKTKKDTGRVVKWGTRQNEICPETTPMSVGVKIQDGRVVKELVMVDTY